MKIQQQSSNRPATMAIAIIAGMGTVNAIMQAFIECNIQIIAFFIFIF